MPSHLPMVQEPRAAAPGGATFWFLLSSGLGASAENMACDEALLELAAGLGRPVLRFYGWTEPAATFGYFQDYEAVAAMTSLRPLLRRPTGGGLVPHDADWTYSVTVPPTDWWYGLKAVDSYRRVHEWVQAALARLGMEAELAPCGVAEGPGQCFVGAERFDLLRRGRKIAGAAQRRRRDGLLIQGSVQAVATRAARPEFERAMREAAEERWGVRWEAFPAEETLGRRCRELVSDKYGRPEYHRNRLSSEVRGNP